MFHARTLTTLTIGLTLAGAAVACSGARVTELTDPGGPIPEVGLGSPVDDAPPADGSQSDGPKQDQGSSGGKNDGKGDGKDTPKPDDFSCDDSALVMTSTDAFDAAKALGLCKRLGAGASGWGVLSAKIVRPDGSAGAVPTESFGLLEKLGAAVPPSGKRMLAISTGTARAPGDAGYVAPINGKDKGYTHAQPANVARVSSLCPAETTLGAPHDGVALELQLRTPIDAKSLSFSHQLFSADYGDDICGQFTDVFAVTMTPRVAGRSDDNVVLDASGDLVSVNSPSSMRACAPGTHSGLTFACPLGTGPLAGTGFETKASTGWLKTTIPVSGNTVVTLRFMIWDAGDGTYDSTVLLDELTFSNQSSTLKTVPR